MFAGDGQSHQEPAPIWKCQQRAGRAYRQYGQHPKSAPDDVRNGFPAGYCEALPYRHSLRLLQRCAPASVPDLRHSRCRILPMREQPVPVFRQALHGRGFRQSSAKEHQLPLRLPADLVFQLLTDRLRHHLFRMRLWSHRCHKESSCVLPNHFKTTAANRLGRCLSI